MITSSTEISNIIDWYSFTCDSPIYHKKATMKCVELEHGMYGYLAGVQFLDSRIELTNPDRPDMRTHVQYSGSALLSSQNDYAIQPLDIISLVAESEAVSRIDVAVDIKNGCLDIGVLAEMVRAKLFISLAQKSMFISTLDAPGETLYIGAPSAKQRLRIYDKAAEQGRDDLEWTRIELQLRGKRANAAKHMIRASGNLDSVPMLIRGFTDFPKSSDYAIAVGNKSRVVGSPEKTDTDTRGWLMTTVVSSLARECAKTDGSKFYSSFMASLEGQTKAERQKIVDKS